MRKKKLLAALIAVSCLLAALAAIADDDYQKLSLTLPKGDAAAGREAFVELSCTSCHAVRGDDDLPKPVAQIPVPVLGPEHGKKAAGKLASAMVSPSHEVSEEVLMKTYSELSPMGDFTEAMTVRQLVDLVAYVQSLADQD